MTQTLFDLTGQTALVTGASRGLGQAMAVGLADAGAQVVITARNTADLAKTEGLIAATGGTSVPLALDVTDMGAIDAQIAAAAAQTGGIDILVNNAGMEKVCPSLELTEVIWDSILDTNLKGAFFCARAAAASMVAAGRGGSIINLCSLTSYVGVPTAVPYGASKSGLLGMTRALATEWAGHGIRVNAIAPGYFRTDLTEAFYQNEAWQAAMLDKIPAARFGNAHDLRGLTIFLASGASAYVTGQCIAVDGGFLASI